MKLFLSSQWYFLLFGCAFAARMRNRQEGHTTDGTDLTVRAFWIRHGLSCANIVSEFAPLMTGKFLQYFYADPSLTDCAVKHARAFGPRFQTAIRKDVEWNQPLPVFSSVLVRSIETALHNFPGHNVYPIPYIAELGTTSDNMPWPWTPENSTEEHTQQAKLDRVPNGKNDIQRVKFLPFVNPSDDPDRDGDHKADYNKFIEEFPKILESVLPEGVISNGTVIPVVIVSHSAFMAKHLGCLGKGNKPKNNEVWVKDYSVKLRKLTASDRKTPRAERQAIPMVAAEGCGDAIIPHETYPSYHGVSSLLGAVHRPCKKDVARCGSSWMPRGWGDEDESCCPSV